MYATLILLSSCLCVITAQIVYDKSGEGITNMLSVQIPSDTEDVRFDLNSISHVPAHYFQNLPNLDTIWSRSNVISDVDPYAFSGVPSVTCIDFGNNKLEVITETMFQGLPNLRILWLGANLIHEIHPGSFNDNTALTELYLESNRLEIVNKTMFANLSNLERLELQFNQIHTIQLDSFKDNTALTGLYLSRNKLEMVKRTMFSGLLNLETLILYGNQIFMTESGSFKKNTALTTLGLQDNSLQTLPPCMFDPDNHPTSLTLRMENNPLRCDESWCWVKQAESDWITVSFAFLTNCAGPGALSGRMWLMITEQDLNCQAPGQSPDYQPF